MISIKELITQCFDKETYIPLLQRNYKWSENIAAKLAQDLWSSFQSNSNKEKKKPYTIGMVTFYDEKDKINKRLQLIDGQQRIITLMLFLKYLRIDKINEFSECSNALFNLKFERDESLTQERTRSYYISNIREKLFINDKLYTDLSRFKKNYEAMIVPLTLEDVVFIVNNIKDLDSLKDRIIDSEEDIESVRKCLGELGNLDELDSELEKMRIGAYFYFSSLKNKLFHLLLKDKIKKLICNLCVCDDVLVKSIDNVLSKLINDVLLKSIDDVKSSKDINSVKINEIKKAILCGNPQFYDFKEIKISKEFIYYILNNVYVLLHITETEPIDEFLNLNKNKTRFGISDHIKANMIIDTSIGKSNRKEITRESILNMFKELSFQMYSPSNKKIWNLISKGYECENDESRLKLMFCDRYDYDSKIGYEYEPEYKRLCYYRLLLINMRKNINEISENNGLSNWNSFNGFKCLYKLKKIRFFKMFGNKYDDEILNKELDQVMWQIINRHKDSMDVNYFIESQLYNEEKEDSIYSGFPSNYKDGWSYIPKYNDNLQEFDNIMNEYINKID